MTEKNLEMEWDEIALEKSQYIEVHGYEFAVGSGGKSGYKYRLQNNEAGIIIFIKNRKVAPDVEGSHLKIELSPHYLLNTSVDDAQNFMDGVAAWLSVGNPQYQGVAPHLALDVQGWDMPEDFLNRLVMRSRRIYVHDGIESAEFNLSEAAVTYGKRETVTVGSVKSVQMSCYDKSLQARKEDKLHYFESVWTGSYEGDEFDRQYDPEETVRRIEMRFHHSVVNQFAMGMRNEIKSYKQVYEHLGGLWKYAMNNFRLEVSKKVTDPHWSLFAEDADFHWCHEGKEYKRAYKKAGLGSEKNVTLALGNMLSLFARKNMAPQKVMKALRKSGIYSDIHSYYRSRGFTEADLYEFVRDSLKQRRLVGRAA